MKPGKWICMAAIAALGLAACGGSDDDDSNASKGQIDVSLVDAPADGYQHVWVTTNAIWFHQSTDAKPYDQGWVKFELDAPATVDLMAVASGNLADVFSDLALPEGTYGQIRMFLLDADDPLTSTAQSAGLSYNAEVDVADDSGALTRTPLYVTTPQDGVAVTGSFDVVAGQTLKLALDFDVNNDLLAVALSGENSFLLDPHLRYYDLDAVGAITGTVDTAALDGVGGSAFAPVLVTVQVPDDAGQRHVIERATRPDADGNFTLFPVPVSDGATSENVDLVISAPGVQTLLVRNVTVVSGTGPTDAQSPTIVQNDPLVLQASASGTVNLGSDAPLSPTAAKLTFMQTLSSASDLPYQIRGEAANPYTGRLAVDLSLPVADPEVGEWADGQAISFADVIPDEGSAAYTPLATAWQFDARTGSTLTAVAGTAVTFGMDALTVAEPAVSRSISGTLTQAAAGSGETRYDRGVLVVSRCGAIITTIALDDILAQNGGTGGAFTITGLPGGTDATPFEDGVYRLSIDAWNSSGPLVTRLRRPVDAWADLTSSDVAGMNVDLSVY